ncbi:MAG: OmpA family protein [Bernardetiaceae bacterium]|jgi:outer membrane protein OmpA-like peptidoglycan-associated protein|nr:OmpA family protein [Bernardetiaceae bacterium]
MKKNLLIAALTVGLAPAGLGQASNADSLKSYSKFDFVAGEKIVALEDFSQDAVGDFPAKWNTNGTGEVVTVEGMTGKWLQLGKQTRVIPDFINTLPENFTLEFDLMCNPKFNFYSTWFEIILIGLKDRKSTKEAFEYSLFPTRAGASLRLHPTDAGHKFGRVEGAFYDGKARIFQNMVASQQFATPLNRTKAHIAIWRQKQRLRMYVNEEKVLDLPRALVEANYNAVMLLVPSTFYKEEDRYLLTNLRLAVGAPDTRNKLLTEGKFVTRGILFDVGSDRVKPQSYGALKEIAQVLTENAALRVKIIGHTDSDGDAAKNLDLSKRRAAAVRQALAGEFGIDAARLETDGKGASQPALPNTSPENKANNRRVEFIKL